MFVCYDGGGDCVCVVVLVHQLGGVAVHFGVVVDVCGFVGVCDDCG